MADNLKPPAIVRVAIGILLFIPICWAAIFGFFFQGLVYGFNIGRDLYDDFWETEASKKRQHSR